ncbi:unnamed protein product [Heterobilharzia americana]|nr:unnamed protein product [Heterobilharzia americana]
MSHRREAGAVPPWVIPEEHARCSPQIKSLKINSLNVDNELEKVNNTSTSKIDNKLKNISAGDTCASPTVTQNKEQLYITGGQLVNSDHMQYADILIENGKIVSTGTNIEVQPNVPIIDATGMLIMPGGIDMATYLAKDVHSLNKEAYSNLTKEALIGGTTTIIDTILCPKNSSAVDLLIQYKNVLKDIKLWCDNVIRIGFLELHEAQLSEMDQLINNHGINSFLFFVDPTEMNNKSKDSPLVTNLLMALEKCRKFGSIAFIKLYVTNLNVNDLHNQADRRDDQLELKSIEKIIFLSNTTNCPVVITSSNDLNIITKIGEARRQIPPVHISACCTPDTLLPVAINGQQYASKFLHQLTNGDIISFSSDQCESQSNHSRTIGQRLTIVWEASVPSGWLDASSFTSVVSSSAARYSGLYPNKGHLHPGSDADLILWPDESLTHSNVGRPILVILHGKIMVQDGKLIEKQRNNTNVKIMASNRSVDITIGEACGILQIGKPFPPAVYGLVTASERLRKRNQIPVNREPWTMNNLSEELNSSQSSTLNTSHNDSNNNAIISTNTNEQMNIETVQSSSNSTRIVHGHRDLHASGFSLSGAQVDDDRPIRSGIRTKQSSESRNPLW